MDVPPEQTISTGSGKDGMPLDEAAGYEAAAEEAAVGLAERDPDRYALLSEFIDFSRLRIEKLEELGPNPYKE